MLLLPYEIWKPINEYVDFYSISTSGEIKSLKRKVPYKLGLRRISSKSLQIRINNCGYPEVRLSKDGVTSTKFMHVLTAEAFIPNPDNKTEVNHKNGNKLDYSIPNLEWNTHPENMLHAYRTGLCSKESKEVQVIDICQNKSYRSIKKAAEHYSIPYSTFKNYLNGNRRKPIYLECLQVSAA